jgi:sugar O-acyltransferase (sialic acid O-acetyltransferase NeuD family)
MNFYIIGAGGFAKEVLLILRRSNMENSFKGFISYKPSVDNISVGEKSYPVIDEVKFLKDITPSQNVSLFIGMGDPKTIKKVSEKFSAYNFPNLISPDLDLDESIYLGKGNIFTRGVNPTVDIKIGSFNIFNLNITIGHDTVIGNFNVLNPGVTISGSVRIGDCNLLGTGATILQNLSIGNNNVIGGNGLLSKNVDNELTMVGVPCKPLEKKTP